MKLIVIVVALGMAATAPGAATEPATQCLIPAAPLSNHIELLAAYRRLVDAFSVCIDAELAELAERAKDAGRRPDDGTALIDATQRRKAALSERAAAIAALRRYERQKAQ